MVAFPSFCIDLMSGLFGGSSGGAFFRLTGLVQYFLKTPSQSHCIRDRCREAARIALSASDWYCLLGKSSACFSLDVGSGLVAINLVGRISSVVDVGVDALLVGVETCTIFVRFSGRLFDFVSVPPAVEGVATAGLAGLRGDDACCFTVDSLRFRAGSTRRAGVASAIFRTSVEMRFVHDGNLRIVKGAYRLKIAHPTVKMEKTSMLQVQPDAKRSQEQSGRRSGALLH